MTLLHIGLIVFFFGGWALMIDSLFGWLWSENPFVNALLIVGSGLATIGCILIGVDIWGYLPK